MKTWRPEGWDNPYSEDKKLTKPWTEWFQSDAEIAYEGGAAAMLEALKKQGQYYNDVEAPYKTVAVLKTIEKPCWLVLIPDVRDK
jgi:hypothetical protein